jgi:hypothetical protein
MDSSTFWKNFNLGTELQISGSFIYNGLLVFDEMETFYHEEEIFEFLYNISVGIERLLKINVILIEHTNEMNQDAFFESIRNHNHQKLFKSISNKYNLKASKSKNAFIQLLNNFYNEMRYDRYTNKDPLNNDKEKKSLIKFIEKYLKIKISNDFLSVSQINKSTKQFIGEVIKSITAEQYKIVTKEATRLNIYIDDIRRYSKAYKIFILEQFNFEFENRVQKELFLKFLSDNKDSPLIAFAKEFEPLEFESYDENYYAKCMFKKLETLNLDGEMELLDENVENIEERIDFLESIGDDMVRFDSEGDEFFDSNFQ